MKVLAIVLLCAIAAVQGRSAVRVVENSSSEVAQERQPWLVHLRYATRASAGRLQSAVGSLINNRWALTSHNIDAASYIWIRLDLYNVIQPGMVLETTVVRSNGPICLVSLNKQIELTGSISPVSLVQSSGSVNGLSCFFGSDNGAPGVTLQCAEIAVEESEDGTLVGSSGNLTEYDLGAALVNGNEQSAVLIAVDGPSATYAKLTDDLLDWIAAETN